MTTLPSPAPHPQAPEAPEAAAPPLSPRAVATRQRLLQAGADLLGEVGIERISTNLVAARAGVTPPVFYRHFKDKYHLVAALGEGLMLAQNEILYDWLERSAPAGMDELIASHYDFMLNSIRVTAEMPGAVWIMRALRAVPSLSEIRLASHNEVTERLCQVITRLLPDAAPDALRLRARLAVDAGYAAIELALEDPSFDPAAISSALTQMWAGGLLHALPQTADHGRG